MRWSYPRVDLVLRFGLEITGVMACNIRVIGVSYGRALEDGDATVRRNALFTLASEYEDHPETCTRLQERALADPSGEVRRMAVEHLLEKWRDEPTINSSNSLGCQATVRHRANR